MMNYSIAYFRDNYLSLALHLWLQIWTWKLPTFSLKLRCETSQSHPFFSASVKSAANEQIQQTLKDNVDNFKNNKKTKSKWIGDIFESLVGAIFLDNLCQLVPQVSSDVAVIQTLSLIWDRFAKDFDLSENEIIAKLQ